MEELDIKKIIHQELILTNIPALDKEDVLQTLTKQLFAEGYIDDKDQFFEDVMWREKEGMTGLGDGVAIPHGKSESVLTTTIAVGITKDPIEWESFDNKPVNVIILFAVRKVDENTTHIKLLQKVAVLLADEELLEALSMAKTNEEVYGLLTEGNKNLV